MDIREIQALHSQYSSRPIVIDIGGHVRALPAPDPQESHRRRVTARIASFAQKFGKPTAIWLAVVMGAGVSGVCAAKLWHALHPPQPSAHIERPTVRPTVAAPVAATASTPPVSQRQLTSADFADPPGHAPGSAGLDSQAPRSADAAAPAALVSKASPANGNERAAASPVQAPHSDPKPTAGQQEESASELAPARPATSTTQHAAQPTEQLQEQPTRVPRRLHRTPAARHHESAVTTAPASAPHIEPAKTDSTPKSPTPTKTGEVPLF